MAPALIQLACRRQRAGGKGWKRVRIFKDRSKFSNKLRMAKTLTNLKTLLLRAAPFGVRQDLPKCSPKHQWSTPFASKGNNIQTIFVSISLSIHQFAFRGKIQIDLQTAFRCFGSVLHGCTVKSYLSQHESNFMSKQCAPVFQTFHQRTNSEI